jgi:hypothetical protein
MARYENEKLVQLDELADVSRTASLIAEDLGAEAAYQSTNVMERVFEGIRLDRVSGELKIDFEKMDGEDSDKAFSRLENEYAERVKAQADVFKAFGEEYDPVIDGV